MQLYSLFYTTKEKTSRLLAVLMLFLLLASELNSQEAANAEKSDFAVYEDQRFREKIFVHADKSFCVTGDVLWFSLYVVEAVSNRPADLSKVAYVELISKNNVPVLQAKITIKKGKGDGSFLIPSSVSSGGYTLRAYTNWMKNFGTQPYFQMPVTIVNTLKKPDWKEWEHAADGALQLFPEGGHLVEGLQSIVAFEVTGKDGKGLDCNGVIVDGDNDTVSRLETFKFGMGTFQFTPQKGKQYKAIVRTKEKGIFFSELPPIKEHGYVLHSSSSGNQVEVEVLSNLPDEQLYLLVHSKGKISLVKTAEVRSGKTKFIVEHAALPDGVSCFSLFNQHKQPVCERLFFKQPAKKLGITLHTTATRFSTREKVNLQVLVDNKSGKVPATGMSVSVVLLDSLDNSEQETIDQYLWLTSELKGKVASPAYYFSMPDADVAKAADHLMLTHGWRCFDSNEQAVAAFEFLPEYEDHIIRGRIMDKKTGLPVKGITAYFSAPGKSFRFNSATTNEKGVFHFVVKNFQSENGIIIQADSLLPNHEISLQNPFSEQYRQDQHHSFNLRALGRANLLLRNETAQVQHIYRKEDMNRFALRTTDTVSFYPVSKTYSLDEFTRFPTMEEVIREYITEARVRKIQNRFHYQVMHAPFKTFFELGPLILIDGVPVFDANKAIAYDPLKVQRIDVVPERYNYGPAVYNGIISYRTYTGNAEDLSLDPRAVVLEYEGLQRRRTFYAPAYATEAERKSRLPDFRTVLHWTPQISVDHTGVADISFYTSDLEGRYAIIVQGLTEDGAAGSAASVIEVAKAQEN